MAIYYIWCDENKTKPKKKQHSFTILLYHNVWNASSMWHISDALLGIGVPSSTISVGDISASLRGRKKLKEIIIYSVCVWVWREGVYYEREEREWEGETETEREREAETETERERERERERRVCQVYMCTGILKPSTETRHGVFYVYKYS